MRRGQLFESNAMVQAFGRFDVHVARYTLDKQEPTQAVVFKTLLQICQAFVAELQKAQPAVRQAFVDFGLKTMEGDKVAEVCWAQTSNKLNQTQ